MATKDFHECSRLDAKEIAETRVTTKGYHLRDLKVSISETKDLYIVNFSPIDSTQRGNEVNLSVAKTDCAIVEENFYQ